MNQDTGRSAVGTAIGRYEDGLKWIGRRSKKRKLDCAVDESRCKYFASLSRDANPSYWDQIWAAQQYGAPIAPSGLAMSLVMPLPWKPGNDDEPPWLLKEIPLPGETFINVDTDCEFLRPILWNEQLSSYEEVVDISPEKTSRLGHGHFVTTRIHLVDESDQTVARLTNVIYRYEAHRT